MKGNRLFFKKSAKHIIAFQNVSASVFYCLYIAILISSNSTHRGYQLRCQNNNSTRQKNPKLAQWKAESSLSVLLRFCRGISNQRY